MGLSCQTLDNLVQLCVQTSEMEPIQPDTSMQCTSAPMPHVEDACSVKSICSHDLHDSVALAHDSCRFGWATLVITSFLDYGVPLVHGVPIQADELYECSSDLLIMSALFCWEDKPDDSVCDAGVRRRVWGRERGPTASCWTADSSR